MGLVDLLEFFLGALVAGVVVRVVFQSQLTVGLFDLLIRGRFGHTQDFVIITFFLCHFHSPLACQPRWPVKPANAAPENRSGFAFCGQLPAGAGAPLSACAPAGLAGEPVHDPLD